MTTETVAAPIAEPRALRPSHRRVLQLFRRYGPMTSSEALEAAKADEWDVSPSGLRSRIAEMCPPRGGGMLDTGRKRKVGSGKGQTVYDLDPSVDEPFISVGAKE